MTPEERRELAKRLAVEHQHTTPSGKVGLCTCRACDDLRRAAAALCEDADLGQRAAVRLLRACEAERERDELRERLDAVYEALGRPGRLGESKADACRDEALRLRQAMAVLVPFAKWADWYLEDGCRRDHHGKCQSHGLDEDCPVGPMREWLARLLSGATTEGDEK